MILTATKPISASYHERSDEENEDLDPDGEAPK